MTEGPPGRHDKRMCVRVWLEVGHACEPRRSALGRALALDWRVWVRGVRGRDISAFVHKVVFYLHPASAFVYPKRVIQEPPYEIQESGCASIEIPIHVYLKHSNKPKRLRLKYSLQTENNSKSNTESRCVYYDVENPSEDLWQALMQAGGEAIARTGTLDIKADKLVVLVSETDNETEEMKAKKYKFVQPIESARKHRPKKGKPLILEEICSKCGDPTNVAFRKHLRSVAMKEDEIDRVSQLYLSYRGYEKSADALLLPPISDPIYKVPELPMSLRGALNSVEADYARQ